MGFFDLFRKKKAQPDEPKGDSDSAKQEQPTETDSNANPYEGLREMALGTTAEGMGLAPGDGRVYGAVVDIPAAGGSATMICMLDKTISLYFSGGGGYLGLGQRYETVCQAGMDLLRGAEKTLAHLPLAQTTGLPQGEKALAYLLTPEGTRVAEVQMGRSGEQEEHLRLLNALIQRLLTEIRLSVSDK